MSDNFNDVLIDIASDPDQIDAFRGDPTPFLDRAPVTPEQRAALLTRNSRRVRAAMEMAAGDPPVAMIGPSQTKRKKKRKKKGPPPVASKQRKPAKRKRAPARKTSRKTATRKTSRTSTKKK